MSVTKKAARKHATRDTYFDLVREFPLRPIRSARNYDRAAAVLDRLAVQEEVTLDPGQRDYLETLTLLVEDYDRRHHPLDSSGVTPIEALKFLLEESGMSVADLGRLLGNRGLASQVLGGKRELSKANIRKLADHFKVSPALFLERA